MDDGWLAEIAKNGKPLLDDFQNVGGKVGHRDHGRRGLDKIQDMILQQDEEEDALDEEAAIRTGISAVYNYVSLV